MHTHTHANKQSHNTFITEEFPKTLNKPADSKHAVQIFESAITSRGSRPFIIERHAPGRSRIGLSKTNN